VLLRDAPGGLEAYLMVRSTRLAAFAGMTVFPGGSVDQGDRYAEPLWRGPDPADWPLAADPELSRALVVAAVRETFEEIGVLLAAPEHDPADFPSEAELAADRAVLESGQATLPGLLRARGLVIRTGLLAPWAHWITPEVEKRRFDTRFFVAELPAGQEVQQPSGEASRALWARPSDALETVRRGELGMLPPTASTLFSLAQFDTVADVFAAAASRAIRPIRPQYVVKDGVGQLVLPPEDAELVPDDGFLAELMAAVSRRLQ
jgi:8-oxo-dGTP pyrophosphatase MutT (NUDIX family)